MKIKADLHTHSIMSGHSFSTVKEMADAAAQKKLKIMAVTDHGPAIPGAPTEIYFKCQHLCPHEINGVKILFGVEANFIDDKGNLDLPPDILRNQDIVLCGFHDYTPLKYKNPVQAARVVEKALAKNPIDIITHPEYLSYKIDIRGFIKAVKAGGAAVEINNRSFAGQRNGSIANLREIIKEGIKEEVYFVVNSDAHSAYQIGCFKLALDFIKPYEKEMKILNKSVKETEEFLKNKHKNKRKKEILS